MIVGNNHLTFCTNIFPGKTWTESCGHILTQCPQVKNKICPDRDFGLGLWLSADAAAGLTAGLSTFHRRLSSHRMYVFTINAFPYSAFHGIPVKTDVYHPDWSDRKRVLYTMRCADILSRLLPRNVSGSISTVPVAYGKSCPAGAMENLMETARYLETLHLRTGKKIRLALEPEPDCYLENTEECLRFFKTLESMDEGLTRQYLGVCVDTCHLALQYENLKESINRLIEAGINIGKIQLSSALGVSAASPAPGELIRAYQDDIYLHQTRIREMGRIHCFVDLGDVPESPPPGDWRVHFHVPLHFESDSKGLVSTSGLLDEDFFETAGRSCRHFEIETYSYDRLPYKTESITRSIVNEYRFVLRRMRR